MRWYNLQDLLPPVYAGVKSMYATAETENTELLNVRLSIRQILENMYIQTCDLETLEYWERTIGIELYGDETEESRRRMVLLYLADNWQITKPYVESVMLELFGEGNFVFEYDFNNNLVVKIKMFDVTTNAIRRFMNWFQTVCPAHIMWGAYHTENTQATNYVSAGTTNHYSVSSQCTVTTGSGTLYLGTSPQTFDTMELS
jgi:hypothetical protein